eukprot:775692-Pyramimonas_sp.AAC.1
MAPTRIRRVATYSCAVRTMAGALPGCTRLAAWPQDHSGYLGGVALQIMSHSTEMVELAELAASVIARLAATSEALELPIARGQGQHPGLLAVAG